MKEEIWKDIRGFEGSYQVSNLGRVRYIKIKNNEIIKQSVVKGTVNCFGHRSVTLYKNENIRNARVQTLVAEAFLDNPNNFKKIRHKDNNKQNNCVENLEYIANNEFDDNKLYNATMKELIISNSPFFNDKSCIDYFIELIYGRISVNEYIMNFINSDYLSIEELKDMIDKPLIDTKFYDYLLNDFRSYCAKLYDNPHYYEMGDFMKFTLKELIKSWIVNIEKVIGEKRKREIFQNKYNERTELRNTDII